MSKQKEIREGIITVIETTPDEVELADTVIRYLHSQGVVIKVERELPQYVNCKTTKDNYLRCIAEEAQQDMLDDGYIAWEPLVEEQSHTSTAGIVLRSLADKPRDTSW